MKILHTADWHLGKLLEGRSRLAEQEIVLNQIVEETEKHQADMVVIAGDVFDNSHPSAAAEELLYRTLKRLSCHGRRLVAVIAGNHDQPSRLEAVKPLAKEHGIVIFGTPKSELADGVYGEFKIETLDKGIFTFEHQGEQVVAACVAYPSEKRLNEVLYEETMEDEEKLGTYTERMKQLFARCDKYYKEETVNLLVSHVYTMGSQEDGSERGIQLGSSYLLPADIFPQKAQYTALGHVHKPQVVPGSKGKIRYSGAILPYHQTDAAVAKECLLVELHPGKDADVTEIYLKNPKPIEKWMCQSYEEALLKCRENKDRPCYVYLYIRTDSYIREDQMKELKGEKDDILEIVPVREGEEMPVSHSSIQEKGFLQMFREYYLERRGVEADGEMLELLKEIAGSEDMEDEAD